MSAQRLSVWTAQRCREPEFQRCLGVDSEAAAAAMVREICEIKSRAELDHDEAAEARWHERIRRRYLRFVQQQNNQCTEEN